MKIAIYGGTFDPIHIGHVKLARMIIENFKIDKLLFVPVANPVHKSKKSISDFNIRCEMINMSIINENKMYICDIENNNFESFSTNTIDNIKDIYGISNDYYFIIGEDSLIDIKKWKDYKGILKKISLICVDRNLNKIDSIKHELDEEFNIKINVQPFVSSISSTKIRNTLNLEEKYFSNGKEMKKYIMDRNLYDIYDEQKIIDIKQDIKNSLSKNRYEHSIRVAEMCKALGKRFNLNERILYLIGITHDICKEYSNDEINRMIKVHEIEKYIKFASKSIYHSVLGGIVTKERYNIHSKIVYNAINNHTIPFMKNLNLYDKILYIADSCDIRMYGDKNNMNNKFKELLKQDEISIKDIDKAMLFVLKETIQKLKVKKKIIDESIYQLINEYERK